MRASVILLSFLTLSQAAFINRRFLADELEASTSLEVREDADGVLAERATAKSSSSASRTGATSNAAKSGSSSSSAASNANACLNTKAIQTGSAQNGNQVPAAGQSASLTDNSNFINFCVGQTLTNGLQTKSGSCNGVVMGKIPSTSNMVTSIITNPKPGQKLSAKTTFNVQVQMSGLAAGSFTNAASTYYSAPQNLNGNGQIIGHTHVTIQDLGSSLQPSTPPDPTKFAFFKGINDAGNGKGLLSAAVTGGLPAGNYRVCTMASSSNHQPVLMPIAQRGAQDDCQKFTVA